jgi:hypothetical protein
MFKVIKLSTALLLILVLKANAQITILDTKKLDKIRTGHTYILVKQLNFPGAGKFLAQMQKAGLYLKASNTYLTIAWPTNKSSPMIAF